MLSLAGEELHRLITAELLELPRHFETFPDCVEFGACWTDMENVAFLLSHTLWFPAESVRNGTYAGFREVEPCMLRDVTPGILEDGRVFVKFEIAGEGRTGSQIREMFIAKLAGQLKLNRRYKDEYAGWAAKLIAYYLDERDRSRNKMREMNTDAAGQETINIQIGG